MTVFKTHTSPLWSKGDGYPEHGVPLGLRLYRVRVRVRVRVPADKLGGSAVAGVVCCIITADGQHVCVRPRARAPEVSRKILGKQTHQ